MKNQFLAVALGATLLLPSCFGGGSGSGNNNGNAENTDNVKGLTTEQMTGSGALDNMTGFTSEIWLTKANANDYLFYPHLKGFNLDENEIQISAENIQPEDWPAKIGKADHIHRFAVLVCLFHVVFLLLK